MKTCISCRHYDPDHYSDGSHAQDCKHSNNTFTSKPDPITGETYSHQKRSPKVMRRTSYFLSIWEGECGHAGRWHELKQLTSTAAVSVVPLISLVV